MKLLLFGANGQVGWELRRALAPLGTVVALGRSGLDDYCGDLNQPQKLIETVSKMMPDVVVNAAAYTAVDKAESEQEQARALNTIAPATLAKASADCGALFVHYSTDYVFDGSGSAAWKETDSAAPLNVYGLSKWQGEELVREAHDRHLVFRTQWVYANRGHNFIRTMLRLATEKDRLDVIDDQIGAPTGADLIADVTAHAVRHVMRDSQSAGTYHLAASGATSWFDYARFAIDSARSQAWPIRTKRDAIHPVASSAFKQAAMRPKNSQLSTHKIERQFNLSMPDWKEGVGRAVAALNDARATGGGGHA
ncbi:MAG: dTDP-4-dehydrorhamnose reductase [Pseudomonadota bacterium]